MTTATESVLFNAIPLLVLAGAYLGVTAAVVPTVWRDRRGAHPVEVAVAAIFPALGVAAALLGALVLATPHPLGGDVWASFAAICVALVPALLLLRRWGDRALLAAGIRRAADAQELVSLRDRELEALAAISTALASARDLESAALPLVQQVQELLGVGFAGVAVVDEQGARARGIVARLGSDEAPWWRELDLDLASDPSMIATVVREPTPATVYDLAAAPQANRSLVGLMHGRSGAWVPIVADGRVVGVLVAVSTDDKHLFTPDELALLEALAAGTALALDRIRSAEALAEALAREQRIAAIARRLHGLLDPDELVTAASDELRSALEARVEVRLGEEDAGDGAEGTPIVVGQRRVGVLVVERDEPLRDSERLLLDAVVRELGLALRTAQLVDENQRRLEQQGALLQAAQVVTSELELEAVLERLVREVTKLLRADAADCYLLDDRRMLRCAAVHGLDASIVGLGFPADRGVAGAALRRGRPVASHDEHVDQVVPHEAYAGFRNALVAPMIWAGEVRGVLGVGARDEGRRFGRAERELLEAFAGLASLALRNAESFAESARQARVQRAFYRIASLLSQPLSLRETLDAAAQAATEALDGDFGAVLMAEGDRLALAGAHELPEPVRALAPPSVLVEAAHDGRTVAAPRVAADDRFDESWRRAPVSSLLAIPVEGTVAGLVVVFFEQARTFSGDDLELARQLAGATRGALDRSRLYEAERTGRALSQQLARTGSRLGSELDPAAVMEEVVEQARALLGADAGAVTLLDGDELVVAAAAGNGVEEAIGARSPSTGRLTGDVVQLQAPVAAEDVSQDATLADVDAVVALGHRAYLGVPLAGRDGALLGALTVYAAEPRSWREDETEALAGLAANASVALANAELYQRLALEHEQSVAILANVADGIVAVDRDGKVVVWNAAAEQITGVPAAEALGRGTADVLRRELGSDLGGANRLLSIVRGGEEVWISLSEAVMRDPSGAVAGRIFAFRDISAERFVEQMKSDFVSTVSHELRTPLTSIYGFAETLLRRDIDFGEEERNTFLGYIASESERLTTIVDALLNVARLDSGTLQVELAPTDVGSLLAEAVEQTVAADGHEFVLDLDDDVPAVQADPDKLRQVLEQLLENAVKYSPSGGTVRLEARRRLDSVEIAVADEGVGIPSSRVDRIFDKFFRASDEQPGTGLGLFIAQGLVAAMGGKIWVDSKEGRGSRFSFELPVAHGEKVT